MTLTGAEKAHESTHNRSGGRRVSTGTMPDFAYSGEGVRVASVSDDSPAAQAGLQKGDIIIRLGKQIVHNLREYSEALKSYKPGDEVTIVYRRDNQEKTGTLKLVAR